MFNIRRITSSDVGNRLPGIVQIEFPFPETVDLFIAFAGFEDRSRAISDSLSRSHTPISKCLVMIYGSEDPESTRNEERITFSLSKCCANVRRSKKGAADTPSHISNAIAEQIQDLPDEAKVALDISGASNMAIISSLHCLFTATKTISLTVYYSEPDEYIPSYAEYSAAPTALVERACAYGDENSMHEFGIANIVSNELFPGFMDDARPSFVVAVPSHRMTRMIRCIEEIDQSLLISPFDRIQWILGNPRLGINQWRREFQLRSVEHAIGQIDASHREDARIVSHKTLATVKNRTHIFASTYDYTEIFKLAVDVFDRHIDKNVALIPMGGKLQAVGLGLALLARREVCAKHARPQKYNPGNYTSKIGVKSAIRFGLVDKIRELVTSIGTYELTSLPD